MTTKTFETIPPLPDSPSSLSQVDLHQRQAFSPLALATDSTTSNFRCLSSFDTPVAIAQFGFGNRESINTSVRHLVQSRPVSPTGGKAAVSTIPIMGSRPFNVGTLAIKGKEVAKAFASTSSRKALEEFEGSRTPKAHKNISDHLHFPTENHPSLPTSYPATISQEKYKAKWALNTNDVCHDSVAYGEEVRNFDQICPTCRIPERKLSRPLTINENLSIRNSDRPSSIAVDSDCCSLVQGRRVGLLTIAAAPDDSIKIRIPGEATVAPIITTNDGTSASPTLPGNSAIPEVESGIAGDVLPGSPGPSNVSALPLPIPSLDAPDDSAAPVSGILTDIAGQLPASPEASALELERDGKEGKQRRRKAAVDKAHNSIRRARAIVLRRRLLSVILGRQLAGPTKDALHLISQGNSISEIVGAASSPPA